MKKSVFIVFDGIDGCGKSTQARMLYKWLKKKGRNVLLTHEPSRKTRLGKQITKLTKNKSLSKKEWLKLFTEDRQYHIKNEILPALKQGKIVISDRYYYSTLAYQLPERKWDSYTREFLKPDLTFICDVPAEIALERIKKDLKSKDRKRISIFEKLRILKSLRKKYLKMKRFHEVRIIDSKPLPEVIFEKVRKETSKFIK